MPGPLPSAHEVEQFVYCAHNWFLARQGVDRPDPGARRAGDELRRIGQTFHEAARYRREALSGLTWSFRVLGVAGAIAFMTIATATFDASLLSFAYLATALVVLNCSAGLLTIALYAERNAKRLQAQTGLAAEPLPDAPVLRDPQWDVSGRLDYVLRAGSKVIPILVKTGHTPAHIHESHAMHMAVQLRLMEATGSPATYGLVTYPNGIFRVNWDADVQGRLRTVLGRMEAAKQASKADRDHEEPGRCRGCARRDGCQQRLS